MKMVAKELKGLKNVKRNKEADDEMIVSNVMSLIKKNVSNS